MQDPIHLPPVIKPIVGPPGQIKNAPPFRLPNLPIMENRGGVKTILRQPGLPEMVLEALPLPGPRQTLMGKWGGPLPPSAPPEVPPTHSPQQGPPQPPGVVAPDGYARVEMHSENGQLSVVGVHDVPGPLILPDALARGYVYEALVGDQQVALGSLTDVGLSRSFANIDVPGPEGKHRIFLKPSFNFFVRIPKAQFTVNNLPQLNILLHELTDAPDKLLPLVPLSKQPGVQAAQVASLTGIRLEKLPPIIRPQFENLLRR